MSRPQGRYIGCNPRRWTEKTRDLKGETEQGGGEKNQGGGDRGCGNMRVGADSIDGENREGGGRAPRGRV